MKGEHQEARANLGAASFHILRLASGEEEAVFIEGATGRLRLRKEVWRLPGVVTLAKKEEKREEKEEEKKEEEAFVNALCNNRKFSDLNLGCSDICAEGTREIENVLCNNREFSGLNLGYSDICAEGAREIENVLCKKPEFSSLNLGCSDICAEGARE